MQSDSTPNSPDELVKRLSERQSELEQAAGYTRRQKQLLDSLLDSDDEELFNERFHKRLLIELVGFMHDFHLRSTARADTIRLKLLKIGTVIRVTVRKVWLAFSEAYPWQSLFAQVYDQLTRLRTTVLPDTG